MTNTKPAPHTVTVDPTKLDAAGHFTYTDEKGKGAYSLPVIAGDGVVWTLSPNYPTADRSKVNLFIYFPPGVGNSPFTGESFHTTGFTAGTTSATVNPLPTPPPPTPKNFSYCVVIVDLNPKPPKVLTDDPVIAHSGSGILRQPLETTRAFAAEIEAKAKEIRRMMEEAIAMGNEIR